MLHLECAEHRITTIKPFILFQSMNLKTIYLQKNMLYDDAPGQLIQIHSLGFTKKRRVLKVRAPMQLLQVHFANIILIIIISQLELLNIIILMHTLVLCL